MQKILDEVRLTLACCALVIVTVFVTSPTMSEICTRAFAVCVDGLENLVTLPLLPLL